MARRYSAQDKALVAATLAANGGNVKRTARETGVAEQTVRDWKKKAEVLGLPAEVEEALPEAIGDFVEDATRIRNKALTALERAIDRGELKGKELTVVIGVLTDKVRLVQGQPTSRTEHTSEGAIPIEQAREIFKGLAAGMIEAADQRASTISTALNPEDVVEATDADWTEQPMLGLPEHASA